MVYDIIYLRMDVQLLMAALVYASMLVLLAYQNVVRVQRHREMFSVRYRTHPFFKKHIYNNVTFKTQLPQQES